MPKLICGTFQMNFTKFSSPGPPRPGSLYLTI